MQLNLVPIIWLRKHLQEEEASHIKIYALPNFSSAEVLGDSFVGSFHIHKM